MKLVAHTKMMMELTVYLAKKILHVIPANLCFVSAFENERTGHIGSEQEETDTKMLLHALDATNAGATSIHMCSLTRSLPLTSILVIQYMYLSRTPAPPDITSWHLGKTKSYPGMALREKLAWQRTCKMLVCSCLY